MPLVGDPKNLVQSFINTASLHTLESFGKAPFGAPLAPLGASFSDMHVELYARSIASQIRKSPYVIDPQGTLIVSCAEINNFANYMAEVHTSRVPSHRTRAWLIAQGLCEREMFGSMNAASVELDHTKLLHEINEEELQSFRSNTDQFRGEEEKLVEGFLEVEQVEGDAA